MHPSSPSAAIAALFAAVSAALAASAQGGAVAVGFAALAGGLVGVMLGIALAPGRDGGAAPATVAQGGAAAPAAAAPDLLSELPLALILLDRNAAVLFANAAAVELLGAAPEGEPLASVLRSRQLAEAVTEVTKGGPGARIAFTHLRAREQRRLLAHLRPVRARLASGEVAAMAVIEDHTRFDRVEQMRRDFIANASHELKTPLASIAGFIETLQGPARDDPAAAERFLPIMAQQADRMKRLIEDLMSLNRIEMNAYVRPEGRVELRKLLADTAAALEPLAESAGVRIALDPGDQPIEVVGDRDELSQLFVNLIDNAIKHGGGEVRVHLAAAEPGRGGMAGVTVSDRGPGIAREHIPRLTERFYRVPAPRGKVVGGTGLGLSIVKHILNRHRGDLAIRSAPGEGASFTAWLPRVTPGESPKTAAEGRQ